MNNALKINKSLEFGGGKNAITAVFFGTVLLFFCVFFINIHPLFPFDGDDWSYMSYGRMAMPDTREWNPGKVFPETLFPFVSNLAAYVVYPLTGNYFQSLTLLHGIVVGAFLTLYFYAFYHLLSRRYAVEQAKALMLTLLFLLFHFLIFQVDYSGNQHLFYTHDVNCYYNYIIPNVLNATLVLTLLERDWLLSPRFSMTQVGFVAATVYLAVFSNLYSSDVLVIFLGCQLFLGLFGEERCSIADHARRNRLKVAVILLFFVFAAFEAMGGRANYFYMQDENQSMVVRFIEAIRQLMQVRVNRVFLFFAVLAGAYGAWQTWRRKKIPAAVLTLVATAAVTLLYILILSAKVNPEYPQRADILFALCFPVLLLMMLSFAELCRKHNAVLVVMPVLLLWIFSRTNKGGVIFKDIGEKYATVDVLQRVNNDIMRQLTKAAQQQADSVMLVVPDTHNPEVNNWPYFAYPNGNGALGGIAGTLKKHGVISRDLQGKTVKGRPIEEY